MNLLGRMFSDNYKKWIGIQILVSTKLSTQMKINEYLKPFAKELNWQMKSETDKKDEGRINIIISHRGGKISPAKFLENKEKIKKVALTIYKDLFFNGDEDKASEEFAIRKDTVHKYTFKGYDKPIFVFSSIQGVLITTYALNDRIDFEKKHKEMAVNLFGFTVEENLKLLFQSSMQKNDSKQIQIDTEHKKALEEMYGFKLED